MVKELIIDSSPTGVTIALIEDKYLVELHKEHINNNYAVGDIYLGRIKKIMPGLNAAFVDVGYEKDAFLHYFDLGPQVQSLIKLTKIKRNGTVNGNLLDNFNLIESNFSLFLRTSDCCLNFIIKSVSLVTPL